MKLLDAESLEKSAVVANCRMNRERNLTGRREAKFPLRFVGAADKAGPNYTGQPAVHSYYERL